MMRTCGKKQHNPASNAGEVCKISDSFSFERTSPGPPLCHLVLSICFDVHLFEVGCICQKTWKVLRYPGNVGV